jgi:hypothetical protein
MYEIQEEGQALSIKGDGRAWDKLRAAVLFVAAAASSDKSLPAFTGLQVEHHAGRFG